MARGTTFCALLHLKEDNARFVLLVLLLLLYMLIGAEIFHLIEGSTEDKERDIYNSRYSEYVHRYLNLSEPFNKTDFDKMLDDYATASAKGLLPGRRPRWDFPGAFYFVATVVSTIGFGMTSPSTSSGRVMLIIYGLPGCAACILFFNIFLERLITLLAYVMKQCHERRIRKLKDQHQNGQAKNGGRRPSEQSDDDLENWKPSVYWVLVYLTLGAISIACTASAVYTKVEPGWSYLDSFYFCFVAFSTIGFGDLVSSQESSYNQQYWYRFGNFIFLTAGVCCIYSFYNVISIIIKQFLNWAIKKLDCRCCHRRRPRPRRNAITPGHLQRQMNSAGKRHNGPGNVEVTDYDSETDGRRMSDEMISMKDFLAANKVSLAVMQKQLYETSQHRHHSNKNGVGQGLSGGVGGLAMLNNKLQETERRD
ncbi:potassium channel subfamily K member 13-like [Diadema setosum]|uniref:potassium channel subfamily K member 13-like n=1 Tax=Diadema setosum TaxID=31175 RepID=UPI003B3B8027